MTPGVTLPQLAKVLKAELPQHTESGRQLAGEDSRGGGHGAVAGQRLLPPSTLLPQLSALFWIQYPSDTSLCRLWDVCPGLQPGP